MKQLSLLLPKRIASLVEDSVEKWECLQEIRIRQGQKIGIRYQGKMVFPGGQSQVVSALECKEILSLISQCSLYAFEEEIRRGYLTIPGGHRIGMTGRVVVEQGEIKTLRHINCFNIRVSHERKGCAKELYPLLLEKGHLMSSLIISPPGGGKTTMLRDLIRYVSQVFTVSLVDERSEIAGSYQGSVQWDVGPGCDVLDGCPKAMGMEMVLRSMGPDVIAVDEIGTEEDYEAMKKALVSGCSLLATMHGEDFIHVRDKGLFQRYVVLKDSGNPGEIKGIYNERGQRIWG